MKPAVRSFLWREQYRYASLNTRSLKCQYQPNKIAAPQTRYLPGIEIRRKPAHLKQAEVLRVINLHRVLVLHGQQRGLQQTRLRYSVSSLSNSNLLELDHDANIISREGYYPFGGTAVWAVRSMLDVDDKTRRYAGKERDLSGLIYYGFRYYVAWLMRWLNADPAGTIDGLNLFRMVRNNPLTLSDPDGRGSVKSKSKSKAAAGGNKQPAVNKTARVVSSSGMAAAGPSSSRAAQAVPAPAPAPVAVSLPNVVPAPVSTLRDGCVEPNPKDSLLTWYQAKRPIHVSVDAAVFDYGSDKVIMKYFTMNEWVERKLSSDGKKLRGITLCHEPAILKQKLQIKEQVFNIVHGEGSAQVVSPDGLIMRNLGVKLNSDLKDKITQQTMNRFFRELDTLHAAGFAHRNLNDKNVLFDEQTNSMHMIGFSNVKQYGESFIIKTRRDARFYNDKFKLEDYETLVPESQSFWQSFFDIECCRTGIWK